MIHASITRSAAESHTGGSEKKRRRKNMSGGSDSSGDLVTEQEREDRDYYTALSQSMEDGDFDPAKEARSRGKGRGRGRGRR